MRLRSILLIVALVLTVPFTVGLGTEEPRRGGTLVIAETDAIRNLDPVLVHSLLEATVLAHIADSLFFMNERMEVEPRLATGYELSEDGLAWTLFLREGVRFHDGTPFNAEAVKFNLSRFLEPGVPFRFLVAGITAVDVVDEHTIKLHTDKPFAPLIRHLAHPFLGILSPTAIKQLEGAVVTAPVGTGPMIFREWIHGERIVVERNENYWGKVPYLDRIIFRLVPEAGVRVMMLEARDAHAITAVPAPEARRLDADPNIVVAKVPGLVMNYLGINTLRGPLGDLRVRQALNYAIDFDSIIEAILLVGERASAPIAPPIFGYYSAGPYPFDPERARELLAEAGYPDGIAINLHFHAGGLDGLAMPYVAAIQAMLGEVGIAVELISMEWAPFIELISAPREQAVYDLFVASWWTVTGDADYGLTTFFHSDLMPPAGRNRMFWENERVDYLLGAAVATFDPEKRREMYAEIIRIVWHEAPWIFSHTGQVLQAVRHNVHGVVHHPSGTIFAWGAWIEE